MVKVRDDLPTVMSKTARQITHTAQPSALSKQKTGTEANAPQILELDIQDMAFENSEIDLEAWLSHLAVQFSVPTLNILKQACELVLERGNSAVSIDGRSSAFSTGIGMANILADFRVEEDVLVAAVLFRSVRESLISLDEITQLFGAGISNLVKGVGAMGRLADLIEQKRRTDNISNEADSGQLSTIYKMLISVTEDVRVVLIKLAERTFAIREIKYAHVERQKRVASEIMNIYAPLAHRLGIAQLKWELEDLSFRYLSPERYKEIAKLLSEKRLEREQYIHNMVQKLKEALTKQNITCEVIGRVKHIYSIYRKMQSKHLSFDQLYDIRAVRVLVQEPQECYAVLGVVHQLWHHIPNQFDDYITNPKANGYRSLHTAVIAENKSLEVQIRTESMHFEAELGVCAHFNYKEGDNTRTTDQHFQHKLYSLRSVLEAYQDGHNISNPSGFDDDDLGRLEEWGELEKIYVFTRDGDIKELSRNATVLDFAYHIHTLVGNRCYAARVNQRYVPLNYKLKTGQQVDILTKDGHEPSRDWLVNSFGYINTVHARDKLRSWFRQQDKSKNLEIGHDILNKELTRLAIHPNSVDLAEFTKHFHVKTGDDLLTGLVTGDISLNALMNQINLQMHFDTEALEAIYHPVLSPSATSILSAHGIVTNSMAELILQHAQCCNPNQDDAIAGFITTEHGIDIHAKTCNTFKQLQNEAANRVIEAYWETLSSAGQSVNIFIQAYDRQGLLKDVTSVIFADKINIRRVNTVTGNNGISELTFQIDVKGLAQLSRLLARIEQLPSIMSARRLLTKQ